MSAATTSPRSVCVEGYARGPIQRVFAGVEPSAGASGSSWTALGAVQGEPCRVVHTVVEYEPPVRLVVQDDQGARTVWELAPVRSAVRVRLCHSSPVFDSWPDNMWPVVEASSVARLRAVLADVGASETLPR